PSSNDLFSINDTVSILVVVPSVPISVSLWLLHAREYNLAGVFVLLHAPVGLFGFGTVVGGIDDRVQLSFFKKGSSVLPEIARQLCFIIQGTRAQRGAHNRQPFAQDGSKAQVFNPVAGQEGEIDHAAVQGQHFYIFMP